MTCAPPISPRTLSLVTFTLFTKIMDQLVGMGLAEFERLKASQF